MDKLKNNFLVELFLYFLKFTKKNSAKKLFNINTSKTPGYSELKTLVDAIEPVGGAEIENYIFGANAQAVASRISQLAGGENYLFIDFGEINCHVDGKGNYKDSSRIAATVAFRARKFSTDTIEQALYFNHSLELITQIRRIMMQEQRCIPWLDKISPSHELLPFVSEEMGSIGWSLIFTRESSDSFHAK